MIIDFKNMEETVSENFKGGEGVLYRKGYQDDMGKIIWLRIPQGSSIGYHSHESDCEVMYIVSGRARCIDDGEERVLQAGDDAGDRLGQDGTGEGAHLVAAKVAAGLDLGLVQFDHGGI